MPAPLEPGLDRKQAGGSPIDVGELVEQLLASNTPDATLVELAEHFARASPRDIRTAVERLVDEVPRRLLADLDEAERLARAADSLAMSGDEYCRARAKRSLAHIAFSRGEYPQALAAYECSVQSFEETGDELEVGRTLSSALHVLIYLGQSERAEEWALRARRIFEKRGDQTRLARLDTNLANLLYRQDDYRGALILYERSLVQFRAIGELRDEIVSLRNVALCKVDLNRFDEALSDHRHARELCDNAGLHQAAVESDYTIAYLYYLRGQYTQALELYRVARIRSAEAGSLHYEAMCDLDQSEIYLELNLLDEGTALANAAAVSLERLGARHDAGRALTYLAIGVGRKGGGFRALELFEKARTMFVEEHNQIWPAVIDTYRALVLQEEGQHAEARSFAEAALVVFEGADLVSRAALVGLLLADIHLRVGEVRSARRRCLGALEQLQRADVPVLEYRAHLLLGRIEEALMNGQAAFDAYGQARVRLEHMRGHLAQDELKIGFIQDKLVVYESLVWMTLNGDRSRERLEAAFGYIEQAKSRSLTDLMALRGQSLPTKTDSGLAEKTQTLREELNSYYRQIDREELETDVNHVRLKGLRKQSQKREGQLLRALRDLQAGDQEYASLQAGATISLDEIRSSLPQDSLVLEYFEVRGTIVVALLSQDDIEIVPLTESSRVRRLMRLLQFQLSKFRLGPEYITAFAPALREAAERHLEELHTELIGPIRERLEAQRLLISPHEFLHYIPFQALSSGGRVLAQDFEISYAPSASVHHLCAIRPAAPGRDALVMGIPDRAAPFIREEVHRVAATLPRARLFLGEEANEARLTQYGPTSRYVHIATHGRFRYDNPMFSSIQLGASRLSLFDLYHLKLGADLVTLSGCGTGLNVVEGGDELIGLARGLLYAGARSALVALWDVNDETTARFMGRFYSHIAAGIGKTRALRMTMLETREEQAHPYYWAPFVLVGTD
jgi:CHAT domain-containing protein